MTSWKRMLLLGLCFLGLPFCFGGTAYGSEKVTLKLAFPEGRAARYKHSYYYEFTSSRAELILKGGKHDVENVVVRIDGEWRSQETSHLEDGEFAHYGTMLVQNLTDCHTLVGCDVKFMQ